jgi:hypothetical protein
MTNDPRTGTGGRAGQQWFSNGIAFGIFTVVILVVVGIGYNMLLEGKERDTEIVASLNQLSKNLTLLSNNVRELKSQVGSASTGPRLLNSESVQGSGMTGQTEGAATESDDPEVQASNQAGRREVPPVDVALQYQLDQMDLDSESEDQFRQIFEPLWSNVLAVDATDAPDKAEQQVELWKDFCGDVRSLVSAEQARQISCAEDSVVTAYQKPRPPRRHLPDIGAASPEARH